MIIASQIDSKSKEEGLKQSRLPEFTEEERAEVAGSWDFLGFNIYTTDLIFSLPFEISFPNYYRVVQHDIRTIYVNLELNNLTIFFGQHFQSSL